MKDFKEVKEIKHVYSDEEKLNKMHDYYELVEKYEGEELDLKNFTKSKKAEIGELKAKAKVILVNINQGFERKDVYCETRYNDPNSGMKSTYRLDGKEPELVVTEDMTQEELQEEMEFDPEVVSEDEEI